MAARDSSPSLEERLASEAFRLKFWGHVGNLFGGCCWEWTRGRTSRGYGNVCLKAGGRKRWIPAHRVAYMLVFGPIADGLQVCHRCDNRACCRPDHLFLGTNDDNVRDMIAKGRNRAGIAPIERPAWGEQHGQSKLKRADALAIRERYAAGGISMKALGGEYGIAAATVFHIIHGDYWKHV